MDIRFAITGRGNEAKRAREVVAQIGGVCVDCDLDADVLVAVRGAGRKKIQDYENRRRSRPRAVAGGDCAAGSIISLDMLENWQATGRRPLASLSSQNMSELVSHSSASASTPFQRFTSSTSATHLVEADDDDNGDPFLEVRHPFAGDRAMTNTRASHTRVSAKPTFPSEISSSVSLKSAVPQRAVNSCSAPLKRHRTESELNYGTPSTVDDRTDTARGSTRLSMHRSAVPLSTVPKFCDPSVTNAEKASERRTHARVASERIPSNTLPLAIATTSAVNPRCNSLSPPLSPIQREPASINSDGTLPAQKREEAAAAIGFSGVGDRGESKGRQSAPDLASLLATYKETASMMAASKSTTSAGRMSGTGANAIPSAGSTPPISQTVERKTAPATAIVAKHQAAELTNVPQRASTSGAENSARQWRSRLTRKPMLPSAARRPVASKTIGGGKTVSNADSSERSASHSKLLATVRQSPYAVGVDDAACNRVLRQVVDHTASVSFSDIAGLEDCKRILQEALVLPAKCPQLFTGLRRPCSGLLLFGPPGNGKTLLAKAVAHECETSFFSISAASITSKWVGESEAMVHALFAVARALAPSTIFIDEVDTLLQTRGSGSEGEGSRRLKAQFLVEIDGAGNDTQDARVMVMGATNRPWDLDDAIVRRFPKRVLVPLPDAAARTAMFQQLLNRDETRNDFTTRDWNRITSLTDGYSGNDIRLLCEEIAMAPVRDLLSEALHTGVQANALDFSTSALRKISLRDVEDAVKQHKPSHSTEQLRLLSEWQDKHGAR